MHLLGLISIFYVIYKLIKEAIEPVIPAENWANKELIDQDRRKGISEKEFARNLANGKYRLRETNPEPHRDENGKIIIENSLLYEKDLKEYGGATVMKWVREGKYNLTPEELIKERQRIRDEFENMYNLLK